MAVPIRHSRHSNVAGARTGLPDEPQNVDRSRVKLTGDLGLGFNKQGKKNPSRHTKAAISKKQNGQQQKGVVVAGRPAKKGLLAFKQNRAEDKISIEIRPPDGKGKWDIVYLPYCGNKPNSKALHRCMDSNKLGPCKYNFILDPPHIFRHLNLGQAISGPFIKPEKPLTGRRDEQNLYGMKERIIIQGIRTDKIYRSGMAASFICEDAFQELLVPKPYEWIRLNGSIIRAHAHKDDRVWGCVARTDLKTHSQITNPRNWNINPRPSPNEYARNGGRDWSTLNFSFTPLEWKWEAGNKIDDALKCLASKNGSVAVQQWTGWAQKPQTNVESLLPFPVGKGGPRIVPHPDGGNDGLTCSHSTGLDAQYSINEAVFFPQEVMRDPDGELTEASFYSHATLEKCGKDDAVFALNVSGYTGEKPCLYWIRIMKVEDHLNGSSTITWRYAMSGLGENPCEYHSETGWVMGENLAGSRIINGSNPLLVHPFSPKSPKEISWSADQTWNTALDSGDFRKIGRVEFLEKDIGRGTKIRFYHPPAWKNYKVLLCCTDSDSKLTVGNDTSLPVHELAQDIKKNPLPEFPLIFGTWWVQSAAWGKVIPDELNIDRCDSWGVDEEGDLFIDFDALKDQWPEGIIDDGSHQDPMPMCFCPSSILSMWGGSPVTGKPAYGPITDDAYPDVCFSDFFDCYTKNFPFAEKIYDMTDSGWATMSQQNNVVLQKRCNCCDQYKREEGAGPIPLPHAADTDGPDDLISFTCTANPSMAQVTLDWVEPGDDDYAGVMIRRYVWLGVETGDNTDPTGGELVGHFSLGTNNYEDTDLEYDTTYLYHAFTGDFATPVNYSTPATICVTFTIPP